MKIKTFIATLFKITAFVLAMTILLPSAVKINHIFTHHNHSVCNDDTNADTHFHQSDFDCEFYKFKLNHNQYFVVNNIDDVSELNQYSEINVFKYTFTSRNQLTKFLRGPPQLG